MNSKRLLPLAPFVVARRHVLLEAIVAGLGFGLTDIQFNVVTLSHKRA
jgi:hypothetical protein